MFIDLSSNNGTVDFSQITGVDEIFVRACLGYGDQDANLSTNANGAAGAGLPVSYYHFAYPHGGVDPTTDAQKQANYFADTVGALPQATHLAVDCEYQNAAGKDTPLQPADYSTWLQAFLDTVEQRTGIKCAIYGNAAYLNSHLPAGHSFGNYPLWIANYNNVPSPTLPNGWAAYWAWQYSETGSVPGVNGHVDLSKVSGE